MKIGERVRHRDRPDVGIGTLLNDYGNTCDVAFATDTFTSISIKYVVSAEEELRIQAEERLRKMVLQLLSTRDYAAADKLYRAECSQWWDPEAYRTERSRARHEEARIAAAKKAQEIADEHCRLRSQVICLLDAAKYDEADRLYHNLCGDWWDPQLFQVEKQRAQLMHRFVDTYRCDSLSALDALYESCPQEDFPPRDFIALKLAKVSEKLASLGLSLDAEQTRACARPEPRFLVRARAGSGKTRTLCARASLAIHDERLDPDQVLILAFNKAAANEARRRVQASVGVNHYGNARTFHGLAYQIAKPKKNILFDAGGDPAAQEQSRLVHRVFNKALSQPFKQLLVDFFRQEIEQIEDVGRGLPPADYYVFRRALRQVTLQGSQVKSSGEKFIADFLFEHGIEFRYERTWEWSKSDSSIAAICKPDFTVFSNGVYYIIEHWAFDPNDPSASVPEHWEENVHQYRAQIIAKRSYWRSKGVRLLETHTGLLVCGRAAFEEKLGELLEQAGVICRRLEEDEIVRRVLQGGSVNSRMAKLFTRFIQSAKQRGWSVAELERRCQGATRASARARIFYKLASRVYREYVAVTEKEDIVDFDDLLAKAANAVRIQGGSTCMHIGQGRMLPISDLRWILLDEYQDFSELYFKLLDAILKANPKIRLVAVGDDWQAINAFAGAQPRFFDDFASYFDGAETIDVTTNYRSDRAIVGVGNRLMEGHGVPGRASGSGVGLVEIRYLDDVWIQFQDGERFRLEREADSLYLPIRRDGKGPGRALLLAQALKLCVEIAPEGRDERFMLLARTGRVYGVELKEFKARLVGLLALKRQVSVEHLEEAVVVVTAHASKGQEAHTVVILDATVRQFPMIHPDNLLFELFGTTPGSVLDGERRLFYVAATRARKRLYIFTERGAESPYIEELRGHAQTGCDVDQVSEEDSAPLGAFAEKLRSLIDGMAAQRGVFGTAEE